ncbi:MAG TPA: AsmA-like C-terminal domain-containing protein [Stellaceae bacterium]|nr:AsmA-like C-terminal domain-containing protein [Stellaceae bacterium]
MHRALRILIRVLAALVAGIAVAAGFAVWLLWQGPISLDPVAPLIADALSRGDGINATVDHALLSLNNDGHVGFLARGVHLSRVDSGAVLTLDQLNLEINLRAALRGAIAPTRIAVTKPHLQLVREKDGSFHLGVGDLDAPAAEDWGAKFVSDLVKPSQGNGTLADLRQISIEQASLTVDDRSLGVTWAAQNVDLSLARARDSTAGIFAIASGDARFGGNYIYTVADNSLVVRLDFADLRPALWADASPALAGLAALDAPFSGELVAVIDGTQLTLRDATWDVSLGPGHINHDIFKGGVLALSGARMQGGYDLARRRLNIGLMTVQLAHGAVGASGTVDGIGSELLSGSKPPVLDFHLVLAAEALKVDDLPALWPDNANADTRNWVTQHLHDGTIDQFQARLGLHLDLTQNAAEMARVDQFDGNFAFSGLSVEYFRPLPPARNVNGTARLSRSEIEFTASSGEVGAIKASAATARFYQLDMHNSEQAKIDVTAAGPLADILALLDTPPFYYARGMGIDPKRAAGNASTQLSFAFPLLRDLPLEKVDYSATASLTGMAIGDAVLSRDLSEGALNLKLDRNTVQASGTAKLAGVPVSLTWQEALQSKAPVRTRYDVTATLDAGQRRALGLGMFEDYIGGPVGVTATYSLNAAKAAQAVATIDLSNSTLSLPWFGWTKAANIPASASVTLNLADDKVTGVPKASLTGADIDAQTSIGFGAKGVNSVVVDYLAVGQSNVHGSLTIGDDGRWTISARGKSLDASALVKEIDGRPDQDKPPPLTIDAQLDRLILGPGRAFNHVSAKLSSDDQHWTGASILLGLGDKAAATVNFGGAIGEGQFKLATDDFGELLRVADIYDNLRGGTFGLTGKAEDRDGKRMLIADANGADYRVVGAPALARLLSIASLSGASALLSGQGIPFSRLAGQVIFTGDLISLDGLRAYGGALGINASGNIDRVTGQMSIAGTLVPAYTLNSVLGNIPMLGNLLLGGEGQGIFAANFRLYGPRDDPKVSVNPLSTLAPGVLRNLFLFSPGGP